MKLILRIVSISFVLMFINAFADTIGFPLNSNVLIGPNEGIGDNVGVTLWGQGVFISALGGTPTYWFDSFPQFYYPGQGGLGPTTIFWDTGFLQIGSTGYVLGDFDLDPTLLNVPLITFPTNGKNFTVTIPWEWDLSGTILTNCPSSGCGFVLSSNPGKLSFSFVYDPFYGAYYANSASFSTVPEPATLTFMAIGIAAVGWRRFRPAGGSV
jgi:PEP-CTERM motif